MWFEIGSIDSPFMRNVGSTHLLYSKKEQFKTELGSVAYGLLTTEMKRVKIFRQGDNWVGRRSIGVLGS